MSLSYFLRCTDFLFPLFDSSSFLAKYRLSDQMASLGSGLWLYSDFSLLLRPCEMLFAIYTPTHPEPHEDLVLPSPRSFAYRRRIRVLDESGPLRIVYRDSTPVWFLPRSAHRFPSLNMSSVKMFLLLRGPPRPSIHSETADKDNSKV